MSLNRGKSDLKNKRYKVFSWKKKLYLSEHKYFKREKIHVAVCDCLTQVVYFVSLKTLFVSMSRGKEKVYLYSNMYAAVADIFLSGSNDCNSSTQLIHSI